MPVYEYSCPYCTHSFEVKQGFNDEPVALCPQCNRKARRVFRPAPVIFKGSGFYATDSRKPETPSEEKKETITTTKKD